MRRVDHGRVTLHSYESRRRKELSVPPDGDDLTRRVLQCDLGEAERAAVPRHRASRRDRIAAGRRRAKALIHLD